MSGGDDLLRSIRGRLTFICVFLAAAAGAAVIYYVFFGGGDRDPLGPIATRDVQAAAPAAPRLVE